MPKETLKIEDFSGGLNTDAEHRDIPDNASPDAVNVGFYKKGVFLLEGRWTQETSRASGTVDEVWIPSSTAGTSAFVYASDYTNGATESGTPAYGLSYYWIATSGTSGDNEFATFSSAGVLANDVLNWTALNQASNMIGPHSHYWVDEGIRIASSNFGTAAVNKVRKLCYNDSTLFSNINDGNITPIALKYWWDGDQEIKAPAAGAFAESTSSHSATSPANDTVNVSALKSNDGNHTWEDDTYNVGYTWVIDGKQESPIFTYANTLTTAVNDSVSFKVTVKVANDDAVIANTVINSDYRRTGARVYIWKDGDSDRNLVLEADWIKGVRANTTDQADATTWDTVNNTIYVSNASSLITHKSFPSTETYYSSNFHGDQEVNYARYKSAVVSNRRTWIGNVFQDGKHYGDRVMYSPIDQYDKFPELNNVTALDSDGDEIVKLESSEDRLLVFKQNSLTILNITNPDNVMVEGTYKGLGIYATGQVCKVETGVAWCNPNGVYLFDGKNVQSISDGKINLMWVPRPSTANDPFVLADACVSGGRGTETYGFFDATNAFKFAIIGYDHQVKKLFIMRGSDADTRDSDTLIYDFRMKSWAFYRPSHDTGVPGDTPLAEKRTNMVSLPMNAPYRKVCFYSHNGTDDWTQHTWLDSTIKIGSANIFSYLTKDYTFGDPSVRKKVYKVYVTYSVNGTANVELSYRVDGLATDNAFTGVQNYSSNTLANSSGAWATAILKPTTSSTANNIRSFQLRVFTTNDNTANVSDSDLKINDITIVYRRKSIK